MKTYPHSSPQDGRPGEIYCVFRMNRNRFETFCRISIPSYCRSLQTKCNRRPPMLQTWNENNYIEILHMKNCYCFFSILDMHFFKKKLGLLLDKVMGLNLIRKVASD